MARRKGRHAGGVLGSLTAEDTERLNEGIAAAYAELGGSVRPDEIETWLQESDTYHHVAEAWIVVTKPASRARQIRRKHPSYVKPWGSLWAFFPDGKGGHRFRRAAILGPPIQFNPRPEPDLSPSSVINSQVDDSPAVSSPTISRMTGSKLPWLPSPVSLVVWLALSFFALGYFFYPLVSIFPGGGRVPAFDVIGAAFASGWMGVMGVYLIWAVRVREKLARSARFSLGTD